MTHNPHFDAVQAAQQKRLAAAMRLTDAEILAAMQDMPPARAYKLAQRALTDALQRQMREAHARPVVAE
jgi:hypothetical protein